MRIIENVDREFAAEMHRAINANDGYCPCALVKSPDTKCMCKAFREQEEGACHCGLYIKMK